MKEYISDHRYERTDMIPKCNYIFLLYITSYSFAKTKTSAKQGMTNWLYV